LIRISEWIKAGCSLFQMNDDPGLRLVQVAAAKTFAQGSKSLASGDFRN